jgi:hypothetical protein
LGTALPTDPSSVGATHVLQVILLPKSAKQDAKKIEFSFASMTSKTKTKRLGKRNGKTVTRKQVQSPMTMVVVST